MTGVIYTRSLLMRFRCRQVLDLDEGGTVYDDVYIAHNLGAVGDMHIRSRHFRCQSRNHLRRERGSDRKRLRSGQLVPSKRTRSRRTGLHDRRPVVVRDYNGHSTTDGVRVEGCGGEHEWWLYVVAGEQLAGTDGLYGRDGELYLVIVRQKVRQYKLIGLE